ncbi:MAG: transaminase [Actinomycetes bacterium]
MTSANKDKLNSHLLKERALYKERNPKSFEYFNNANNLFGKVPMTWMNKWAGGFPIYLEYAKGNTIVSVDGHSYIDFALGDTAAMAGHSPEAVSEAINNRYTKKGGATTMLPTEDAQWVAEELKNRFKVPLWSFSLSATDANRWALRLARMVTKKTKVLAVSYGYHGTVDETFVVRGENGETLLRPGNVGSPFSVAETTRVAEFNDLESVEKALANGDVAVIITEPALTNIGIVLPEPGFLEGLRELATKYGSLLLIDETHTFSAGYGGMTLANNLNPDIVTIGKSIGGGIPSGAYGITKELAEKALNQTGVDLVDVGGVGGTLSGNALSVAAMRATLEKVLTKENFDHMIKLATKFTNEVQAVLDETNIDWSISQLGARAEYRFTKPAPKNGTESALASDDELDEFMHLYTINRNILMTPFHNMALMCPVTKDSDVDAHTKIFKEAVNLIL